MHRGHVRQVNSVNGTPAERIKRGEKQRDICFCITKLDSLTPSQHHFQRNKSESMSIPPKKKEEGNNAQPALSRSSSLCVQPGMMGGEGQVAPSLPLISLIIMLLFSEILSFHEN